MKLYQYKIQCGDWISSDYEERIVLSERLYSEEQFSSICKRIINTYKTLDIDLFREVLSKEYGFFIPTEVGEFYLKEFSSKYLEKMEKIEEMKREQERIDKLPRSYDFIDEIQFVNEVYKVEKCVPHLINFNYNSGIDNLRNYQDHQYLKKETKYKIGTEIITSKEIAKRVFGAYEIYPVFDAYRAGVLEKLSLVSSSGNVTLDYKGYLIEKIIE